MQIERQLVALAESSGRSGAVAGRWCNRLGSVMDLQVSAEGAITGTFRTGVGAPHPERTFQLTGYAHGTAVAFCVDFAPHGSVAAWVGHHVTEVGGAERLTTLYHLARPVIGARTDADVWESVIAGGDEFTRE